MALAGVGVGWLPNSLADADVEAGRLSDLSSLLPNCELSVMAIRLQDADSRIGTSIWKTVESYSES